MVLCAGYGTRLGHLTQNMPKPMLRLKGIPVLEYIIRQLAVHGFDNIVINLHVSPEIFEEYFQSGSRFGVTLTYSYETELMGTAGGVKKAERYFRAGGPFLIHYGDVLTEQDFSEMLHFHREKRALATLLLHWRRLSNSVIGLNSNGRITAFLERPTAAERQALLSPWVNSGICLVNGEFLDEIPAAMPCDLAKDIFPRLASRKCLYGFPLRGFRCALDSPERFAEAGKIISEKGSVMFKWLSRVEDTAGD